MTQSLNEFRIADVATFLSVLRAGSVTAAARQLGVTPSQVSKAVARFEGYVKARLVMRKGRGVAPTETAKAIHAECEELVRRAYDLPRARTTEMHVTIGAPSYLASAFFPHVASCVREARFRAMEAGPTALRVYAADEAVQMTLTLAPEKLPAAWVSTRVGKVYRSLYGSPKLARQLGARPTVASLSGVPFVLATHYADGRFVVGDDGCPLPHNERTAGHDAATIGVAVALAAKCDQLVYGPEIAARALLLEGSLVEIKVPGFRDATMLHLHVNSDRILSRIQKMVVAALREVVEPPG